MKTPIYRRIGLLGGTFNPIHMGHLILAREAMQAIRLDKLIFVPAYIPPHKTTKYLSAARHRFNMVSLAIRDNPRFSISDFEIRSKRKSYSIFTVTKFKEDYGKNVKLFFIAGSDSLMKLSQWKDINKIMKMATFVIATRPGFPIGKIPKRIVRIKITPIDISSKHIRSLIRKNISIRYLVPEAVRHYIVENRLYK